jgi:hypothetical protein
LTGTPHLGELRLLATQLANKFDEESPYVLLIIRPSPSRAKGKRHRDEITCGADKLPGGVSAL